MLDSFEKIIAAFDTAGVTRTETSVELLKIEGQVDAAMIKVGRKLQG